MKPLAWGTLALVILLTVRSTASALTDANREYSVLSWTETDGLPSSSIWALARDVDGYLWLGTNEGLVRFDGIKFIRWNALSNTPLPERRVMTLLTTSDGSLWVGFGGSGGISRIQNMQVTNYGRQHGMAEDFVVSLIEDRGRSVWAAGPSGLYQFRGQEWKRIGAEHGVPEGRVSSAFEDSVGNLWIGTTAGVLKRSVGESTFRRVDAVNSAVHDISEDSAGAIWTTDPFVGVRRLGHVGADVPPRARLNGTRLIHDRRGNLWMGTFGDGLWNTSNHGTTGTSSSRHITTAEGLSGNSVRCLLEDAEGNIWVGADGGLSRLSRASVTAVRDIGTVRSVAVSLDGIVWAGTTVGLIKSPGTADQEAELVSSSVLALHVDRDGVVWAATDQGIVRRTDSGVSQVALPPSVRAERITAITTDSQGGLWFSDTVAGVFRLRQGRLTDVTALAQIGRRTAYALYSDRQDRVWLAFSGGILAVVDREDHVRTYGPGSGGSPRAILQGRGDTIWVAGDQGLSRLTDGKLVTASRQNGLPGNAVTAVVEDPDGYIWAGVHAGIVRVSPTEFDALTDNPNYQVRYRLYDRFDGLLGLPLWLGSPSASGGTDGRLWFVTGSGLAVADSTGAAGGRVGPRARIEAAAADDNQISVLDGMRLPALTSRVQIEFTAPGHVSVAKIRFRYRLEGYDSDWVDAGTRRLALYTGLPPRSYRFRVMATTTEGPWTDEGDGWAFEIEPAFYQRDWFYKVLAVAVSLLLLGAWRLRVQRIKRQYDLVLAERTRVGRELHDTLLQNLVGVALQIEALSRRVDEPRESLARQLRSVRMQVESHVREVRESIWGLRSPASEHQDFVSALRQAGERATSLAQSKFVFAVSGTPYECPPIAAEQLLRIAREAIQNSIRHARATSIHVRLSYEPDLVRLRVCDDGVGFDSIEHVNASEHYGLTSMRERAALVGGSLTITSGQATGTTVEAAVPV